MQDVTGCRADRNTAHLSRSTRAVNDPGRKGLALGLSGPPATGGSVAGGLVIQHGPLSHPQSKTFGFTLLAHAQVRPP